jgi:hypothetical protein
MELIERIQPDIAAKLASEGYFSDIGVFQIREERIQADIDKALAGLVAKAGKIGVAVEVMMPMIVNPTVNAPGPQCVIQQLVRVKENPVLNLTNRGTGKTAESIGVKIVQVLHHFQLAGIAQTFYPSDDVMVPNRDFLPMVTYDVKMLATFPMDSLLKCPNTGISESGGSVTLTCALAGASIYYTTNETFPGPGNAAAHVYAAPFAVSSGTVVRSAAYKAGYIGSDVAWDTVS